MAINLEWLARKLQFIIPEKVQKWAENRQKVDQATRELMDQQLIHYGKTLLTASGSLQELESKLLLSLPPEAAAAGSYELGTVVFDKERWPYGLRKEEIIQNLSIFGRSGSGKTNVSFQIIKHLIADNVPFVFFDWKRTGRDLIPLVQQEAPQVLPKLKVYTPGRNVAPLQFNPFIPPPGLDPHIYAGIIVDILDEAFTLGDGSRLLLTKAILACYSDRDGDRSKDDQGAGHNSNEAVLPRPPPTVERIIEELQKQPDQERIKGWKITAEKVLHSLQLQNLSGGDPEKNALYTEQLLESFTFLELDGLNKAGKKFLIPIICLWIYYTMLYKRGRETLRFVIFLEEAHNILKPESASGSKDEDVFNMLIRQCRELGIGIAIIDQHPSLVPTAVVGNTHTSIFLNLKDPADTQKTARICFMSEEEKAHISRLPIGTGIVKLQDRWVYPFTVKFNLTNIKKGRITDNQISDFMGNLGDFRRITALNPDSFKNNASNHISPSKGPFPSEEEISFMDHIQRFPLHRITDRYKDLGLNPDKGNRIKRNLESRGLIESATISLRNSRITVVRLTEKGFNSLFSISPSDDRRPFKRHDNESIEHEYWKLWYANQFSGKGYAVQVEAPIPNTEVNARADILAVKNGIPIICEIETGKSLFNQNLKNALIHGVKRVFLIATSKPALKKIELDLAKEGLLIPSRISLLLAGDDLDL